MHPRARFCFSVKAWLRYICPCVCRGAASTGRRKSASTHTFHVWICVLCVHLVLVDSHTCIHAYTCISSPSPSSPAISVGILYCFSKYSSRSLKNRLTLYSRAWMSCSATSWCATARIRCVWDVRGESEEFLQGNITMDCNGHCTHHEAGG
jgi:hypothetical protein